MNRKGFIGRLLAALGVVAAAATGDQALMLPTSPPAPPCPRCGGDGEVIVETQNAGAIRAIVAGSHIPVPYASLYETRPCPQCGIAGLIEERVRQMDEQVWRRHSPFYRRDT